MTIFVTNVEFYIETCGDCGAPYAITERFRRECENQGKGWNCPYCKVSWGYYGDNSKIARLQKQLKNTQINLEAERACCTELKGEVKHKEKQVIGYKGAYAKIKKKVNLI